MGKEIKQTVLFICFCLIILILFRNWFLSSEIIGGDWPYIFQNTVNQFPFLPFAWEKVYGNGLGGTHLVYALDSYLYSVGWFFSSVLHIPWSNVYKFFWFWMFLLFASFSIKSLLNMLFPKLKFMYQILGMFLYTANTYILLVVSGGQMGIALVYGFAPFVVKAFMHQVHSFEAETMSVRQSLYAGFLYALLVVFDLRIAYIATLIIILYILFAIKVKVSKKNIKNMINLSMFTFLIPISTACLLHMFWILPTIFTHNNPLHDLGGAYTSIGALQFFSFASFSNAIGLLHPNWPENIFGKVTFMKPEYLFLPILALSNLLFIQLKKENRFKNRILIFFSIIGLIGIFLAKGVNEPFGQVFIFLFKYIPGFIMFRDPTKFYWVIALSYSVLIPISLFSIVQFMQSKISRLKKNTVFSFENILIIATFAYLLFIIRPVFFGHIGGTFSHHEVPSDYIQLKNKLSSDNDFYRTLWIPRQQRFAFSSNLHPAVEAGVLLSSTDAATLNQKLHESTIETYLSDLSIRDIIIPYDPYGEIFLVDRKYSEEKRKEYEKMLDSISWLKKSTIGRLDLYQLRDSKDLFYFTNTGGVVSYKMLSPTHYRVTVSTNIPSVLIFAENYSSYWTASINGKNLASQETQEKTNSFVLDRLGKYTVEVYYSAEKYYIIGRVVSVITLIGVVILIIKNSKYEV